MDPQPPSSGTTGRNTAEPSQPPQSPASLPPSSSSTPPISASLHSSPNPNPNPIRNPNPIQPQTQTSISRPPTPTPAHPRPPPTSFNRSLPPPQQPPHPHQQSHFHHFSYAPPSSTASPVPGGAAPKGGMAIGVRTHPQSPSPPFSSSFGQHQHFGLLNRTGVNVSEPPSNSNTSQVKAPMQVMGMLGSAGSSSQMRPGGVPAHQQRPVQSSIRPPLAAQNYQSTPSQSFQGHGLMRASSVGSPVSPSPSASQSMQSLNQPWLSSGLQGKPPLPSPSYRQQLNPQSMQQRSHIISQQQQQPMPTASQQMQQQPLPSNQSQEYFGQQVPSSRAAIHVPHQQQVTRTQGSGNQKPSSLVAAQSSAVQTGIQSRLPNADTDESSNSILSKRSIHELVNQWISQGKKVPCTPLIVSDDRMRDCIAEMLSEPSAAEIRHALRAARRLNVPGSPVPSAFAAFDSATTETPEVEAGSPAAVVAATTTPSPQRADDSTPKSTLANERSRKRLKVTLSEGDAANKASAEMPSSSAPRSDQTTTYRALAKLRIPGSVDQGLLPADVKSNLAHFADLTLVKQVKGWALSTASIMKYIEKDVLPGYHKAEEGQAEQARKAEQLVKAANERADKAEQSFNLKAKELSDLEAEMAKVLESLHLSEERAKQAEKSLEASMTEAVAGKAELERVREALKSECAEVMRKDLLLVKAADDTWENALMQVNLVCPDLDLNWMDIEAYVVEGELLKDGDEEGQVVKLPFPGSGQ